MKLEKTRQVIKEYPKPFWVLILGSLIDHLGGFMLFPFFTLYLTSRFQVGMMAAGFLFTFFSLGGIVGSTIGGLITDKFGRKFAMLFGLISSGLSSIAMVFSPDLSIFYILAFIAGMLGSVGEPAQSAMIVDLLPTEKQADGFGMLRIAVNISATIGPAVGSVLILAGFNYLFYADAISSFITAVIVLLIIPETKPGAVESIPRSTPISTMTAPVTTSVTTPVITSAVPPAVTSPTTPITVSAADRLENQLDEKGNVKEPRKKVQIKRENNSGEGTIWETFKGYGKVFSDKVFVAFVIISIFISLSYMQMYSTLSVYLRDEHGFSEQNYGWLISLNALMVVLFQLPITRRISKKNPFIMMSIGALLYAIGFGMYGFISSAILFFIAIIIITIGEMILAPFGNRLVADLAPEEMRGRYMAVFGISWAVPSLFGVVLSGYIMDHFNSKWIWYGAGLLCIIAAVGMILLKRYAHNVKSSQNKTIENENAIK